MSALQPETFRQRDLENHKRAFVASNTHGQDLLDFLRRGEVGVWRVERDDLDGARWWLNVQLPPGARELFDLPMELLLVHVERYSRVEPRLLEEIQRRLRDNPRLEEGFAIVVNNDPDFKTTARRKRGQLALIDLQLADLKDRARGLREHLADVLVTLDHFRMTVPVKESAGFFGRGSDIGEISAALNRGQSVGVFGLRKAGKTSLLYEVSSRRRQLHRVVADLDLSTIIDNGAYEFRVRLVSALRGALEDSHREVPRLRLLTAAGDVRREADDQFVHRNWFRDVESLVEAAPGRIELFVDEVDQVYPPRSLMSPDDAESVYRAMVQLRGLLQQSDPEAGITLACFGVDPALFEVPIMDGRDNLLYKLVRLHWLAPMPRDEMNEMLRNLGKRMGVRFTDNSPIDTVFGFTGGHPLLARMACSQAVRAVSDRAIPFYIDTPSIEKTFSESGQDTVRSQVADVMESFQAWFPEEADLASLLVTGDRDDRALAEAEIDGDVTKVEHAIAYGLLTPDLQVRIKALGLL